jgi:predicted phosphodiesterase
LNTLAKVTVVHGSYFNTEFVLNRRLGQNEATLERRRRSDVIITGHCGLPFNDVQNEKMWLNPGVMGMPANDGQPFGI